MLIRNSIQMMQNELAAYRREMHRHPQTSFEETFASDLVAGKLAAWGIPFERGIGQTGIVATITGTKSDSGKAIGIRADMDALDIPEAENKDWVSTFPGKMHGCGHDGHTSILLGVAKYLFQNNNFNGVVHLIFQPAEESGSGANAMIADGLFKRFPCDAVYALHNWPYAKLGQIEVNAGPAMAHVDYFEVHIIGRGGHASKPHTCVDPIVIAAQVITTLQTVISRAKDPFEPGVLSVTNINGGTGAFNVTPDRVVFNGTVRTYSHTLREKIENRIKEIAQSIAADFGAKAECLYEHKIDATINDPKQAAFCARIAEAVVGADHVSMDGPPSMGGEDFGSFLDHCPGAYVKMGQGTDDLSSPCNHGLHNPSYDFNDDLIPLAIEYWTRLVEEALPL